MTNSFILIIASNNNIVKILQDDSMQFELNKNLLSYIDRASYSKFFEWLAAIKTKGDREYRDINFMNNKTQIKSFFVLGELLNSQQYIFGSSSPNGLKKLINQFNIGGKIKIEISSSENSKTASFSDYHKALNELSKINNEMATLQRQLNQKTVLLEKANKDLESFTAAVSHDLHAPVRGIIGFLEFLEEDLAGKISDESQRLLDIIKQNAGRMKELIQDLLNFSRTDSHFMGFKKFSSNKLVKQVVQDVLQLNPGRNIHWEIQPLLDTKGDEKLMYQVWVNLIGNAVKYSKKKEKACIEIKSEKIEKEIVYSVTDNGAGFNQKYKDKLFGAFQRLHSNIEFEGTGIGLANVQKIVNKHGGRVWAEGEVDKGATFYFSLPLG